MLCCVVVALSDDPLHRCCFATFWDYASTMVFCVHYGCSTKKGAVIIMITGCIASIFYTSNGTGYCSLDDASSRKCSLLIEFDCTFQADLPVGTRWTQIVPWPHFGWNLILQAQHIFWLLVSTLLPSFFNKHFCCL